MMAAIIKETGITFKELERNVFKAENISARKVQKAIHELLDAE